MEILKYLIKLPGFKQVYRQGGVDSFTLAHKDIRETMADDLDKRAEELAKQKLATLLTSIDEKRITTLSKTGMIYIGGEQADAARLGNLKAEAEFFSQSDLWGLLTESPRKLAQEAMFVSGESLADLNKGRSMLYTLSTQDKILRTFLSYNPK
jgi:hypothetical protein